MGALSYLREKQDYFNEAAYNISLNSFTFIRRGFYIAFYCNINSYMTLFLFIHLCYLFHM